MSNKVTIAVQKLNELELLASVFKLADTSIIILKNDGTIEWVNSGFERLHGYIETKVDAFLDTESLNFIKILHDIDSGFFQKNPSVSFTRKITDFKGETKWILSNLTPIKNQNNAVERYIVIETDITQQKDIEEDLVQRWENSRTLSEHLESAKDYVEEQVVELIEQKKIIEQAKEKSEEVLHKVLPYEVAIQLQKKGYASPRSYKKVTLLHLNIRNFFHLTDTFPLEELVEQLHESLVSFDNVLEKHYVEKIKTAGGIYLGAGGVPLRNRSNPIDVVLSALEIQNLIKQINLSRTQKGLPEFNTGMGIHTGKVIAGVVGKTKLTYDIWGDTVNIASKIEQSTPDAKVYISQSTYLEIHEFFETEEIGDITLESNESIKLFEVKKIKDTFANNADGFIPNEEFLHLLSKI